MRILIQLDENNAIRVIRSNISDVVLVEGCLQDLMVCFLYCKHGQLKALKTKAFFHQMDEVGEKSLFSGNPNIYKGFAISIPSDRILTYLGG